MSLLRAIPNTFRRGNAPEGPRPGEFPEAPYLVKRRAQVIKAMGDKWLLHPANAVQRKA